ncbi:MAG: 16S rRNA (uracil(1498)-N(3))-methyltransferase [Rhodospirillales bacterium]|nr:16S rRNA (uracil(1498)-N(3))-methyltransferase [Rhodospirillales bacterium]MDE0381096.1 16S rRNA (uracil(1498)-N(3))-methyltransferase [Rhodospirillales bacterium]
MTVTSREPPPAAPEREGAGERSAIRLFVEEPLAADASLALAHGQAHYLRNVMRRAPGDRIRLFNGRDGEWEGIIESIAPRRAAVRLGTQTAAQRPVPDVRLLFAPLKATRTRFVVEKATELGVGAIHPVLTRHGQTTRVNVERLRAHAIEAAEQCGRLDVPSIVPPCPLADALAAWPPERRLLVCDPAAESTAAEALGGGAGGPWAILIGPEGGFAPSERRLLADHPAAVHVRLGPCILRAETAVAAALACWQALAGDWR